MPSKRLPEIVWAVFEADITQVMILLPFHMVRLASLGVSPVSVILEVILGHSTSLLQEGELDNCNT